MSKKGKNVLLIISLIFSVLSLLLAFTPVRMFGIYIALFAILLLVLERLFSSKEKSASKVFLLAWLLPLVAILLIVALKVLIPKKVAKDEEFKKKIEQVDTSNIEQEFNDIEIPADELDITEDSIE